LITRRNDHAQLPLLRTDLEVARLLRQQKAETRKLSYRKDDRAMRPIYGWCPENFWKSLTMPTTTFPEIFNGLFFRLML